MASPPAVLTPPIVVNLFSGPGAGKSTIAALLFGKLKLADIRCELVPEYAKELLWEGAAKQFADKNHITQGQLWRLQRLVGEVDVIITDSPILLGLVYASPPANYRDWLWDTHFSFDSLDYFLVRNPAVHRYQEYGRTQNEEEARAIDLRIVLECEEQGVKLLPRTVEGEATAERLRDEVLIRLAARRVHGWVHG